jgi:hypothetical protein
MTGGLMRQQYLTAFSSTIWQQMKRTKTAGKWSPDRAKSAAILIALAAAGFTVYQQLEKSGTREPLRNDLYMPVVDPILEPDRPDLIGDSLSDE